MRNWKDLKFFAESCGFVVTSTNGDAHNVGSKHYLGLAIDVRTRDKTNAEISLFIRRCGMLGVKVRDERQKPANQKVWSGSHLHLEITPDTAAKVKGFQTRNNLKADGIAGAQTISAICQWCS